MILMDYREEQWFSICFLLCDRLCFCRVSERQVFLATWKDIPNENELQYQIKDCHLNAGQYQF